MDLSHTKKDEDARWWWRQIQEARAIYRNVSQMHYRVQLKRVMDLDVDDIVVGREGGDSHVDQVNVLYIPRYVKWVESQAFDWTPEVKVNRFTTPDTVFGDRLGELLDRVGFECGEMEEWRGTIADAATNGVYAVWYGIHSDVSDFKKITYAQQPMGQIIEQAAQGLIEARPGQEHSKIAEIAANAALGGEDEQSQFNAKVTALSPGGQDIQENLLMLSEEQKKAAKREAKKPHDWRMHRAKVWCQRRPVGQGTLWDATADDIRDARWVARKIIMDVDLARAEPAFNAQVRTKIEPWIWEDSLESNQEDGYFRGVRSDRPRDHGHFYNRVEIWEIWDRKYRERHYVTLGMDDFLERDASDPHAYEDGTPALEDFVPCVIEAPQKSVRSTVYRPYGIPTTAIGWPMQELMIKLASHNLDAVKKLTVRILTVDDKVDDETFEDLQSGVTGTMVKRPATATAQDRPVVEPVNFGSVPPEIFREFQSAKVELAALLAWPVSQMTGQPVAETATAEQISVTAGHSQLGDFIRAMEQAFSRGQEIKARLIKRWYSDEQVSNLIGDENLPDWRKWKASSLDGDRILTRFQSRIDSEDPIRKKQLFELYMMAQGIMVPGFDLPMYETEHMLQEIARLMGAGKLQKREYDEATLQAAAARAQAAMQAGMEKAGGGRQPDARDRDQRPSTPQQENAAVNRIGPSPAGNGRGMFPR